MHRPFHLLPLLFCLLTSSVSAQQKDLRGIVLDGNKITLLSGVWVQCGGDTVLTDENGMFDFDHPGKVQALQFRAEGYLPVEKKVDPGEPFSTIFLYPLQHHDIAAPDTAFPFFGSVRNSTRGIPVSVSVHQNETYDKVIENPFEAVANHPFSSFPLNVNHASYSNLRRFILQKEPVPPAVVRIEEMINYFPYRYPLTSEDTTLSLHTALSRCPWNPQHLLMRIGVQAYRLPPNSLPPNNLVLVVDISGSMEASNKLPLLKEAFRSLVEQLDENDRIAVVVYAGNVKVALPSTPGDQKKKILDMIGNLNAGGSTAGSAGIEEAFKLAKESYIPSGNNRIILATDGDFNVGKSSDADMQHLIARYHDWGIYLTCIGVGVGNYKDSKLETMARWGQGNFVYLDNPEEAQRIFNSQEYTGTLFTLARKAGIKVIFNPEWVSDIRLIGYEQRLYATGKDTAQWQMVGGSIGSGQQVTALYELKPARTLLSAVNRPRAPHDFRTQDYLAKVILQYIRIADESEQINELDVPFTIQPFQEADADFRFAAGVALFGMLLHHSDYLGNGNYGMVEKIGRQALDKKADPLRKDFMRLTKKASRLNPPEEMETSKP